MNETKRTLIYVAVAVVSVGAASFTHFATRPKQDSDSGRIGKQFYEEFQDPTAAQVLKVVAYDEKSAAVKDFKVEYRNGKWLIPSHHNYPADAKDRLAKTAASVIGITRGAFVTRLKSEYAKYNVVDPEDPDTTLLKGRGDKIMLSKSDGTVLADYIVGKKVEGQTDAYYVRCPRAEEDPDAVYIAKLKIDLTTKFADWIEPDLLKVDRDSLTDIRIDTYSIDETRGVINPGQVSELTRKQSGDPWKLAGLKPKEELKTEAVNQLVTSLDGLRIVGVRPKPPGVKPDLSIDRSMAQAPDVVAVLRNNMIQRGYYLAGAQDGNGTRLVSKEGELEAGTNEGVRYLLNFGQIFSGTEFDIETGLPSKAADKKDAAKSAADAGKKSAESDDKSKDLKKNRYLMIYTRFDPKLLGDLPKKPSEPKKPEGVVLDAPANSAIGKTSTAHASPAARSAKGASGAPATTKPGNKHSSIDRQTDDNMLALAFADPKEQSPANPATKKADPPSPPSAASKSGPATKASAKPPAAAKAAPPTKPDTAKPAPTKPAPPKPDPKAEYQKSMTQYKKDLEKYENDKSEYEKKLKKGEEKVKQLNERFGPWYYVISAESFENLRLSRASLVGPKEKATAGEPKAPSFNFPPK